jgi:hypothetical protein
MTEPTAPFGGLAVAEPQTALLTTDAVDDSAPDNRRKLAIVGAVVGVVVLLVAAFFLMKGGDETVAPIAPHVALPAAGDNGQGQDGGKATADKPVKLPKSYDDPVGRDPFKAQYTAPVAAKPGDSTGTTTSGTPTTSDPGASDNVTVTSAPGTSTVPVPVWVELLRVKGTRTATFVVAFNTGSSLKTEKFAKVAVPSTADGSTVFGGVFALLSIHDGVATIQYGDGTPIDLAPGAGNRLVVS